MNRSPHFLVPWESRWRGFLSAVPVAISRSAPRIALEGQRPHLARGLTESFLLHLLIIVAICVFLQNEVEPPPRLFPSRSFDDFGVVYFQEKLPEIGDDQGAREGQEGSAGGKTTFHAQQIIRVARGEKTAPLVAYSSPSLRLPISNSDLANILVLSRQLPTGPKAPLQVRTDVNAPRRFPSPAEEPPKIAFGALPAEQPTLSAALVVPKFVPQVETLSSDTDSRLLTDNAIPSSQPEPSQSWSGHKLCRRPNP